MGITQDIISQKRETKPTHDMKKLFYTILLLPLILYSQNYNQQNFLLPLEITGFQLIQEGVNFEIPPNSILHMPTSSGAIQLYLNGGYSGLDCPCILGPGNIVRHSYFEEYGILYYFDESSYIKPISISGSNSMNSWIVPENKFWYVLHSELFSESFNRGDILWPGEEIYTDESSSYFFAVEYDVLSYNSSLSAISFDFDSSPKLFPNPTTEMLALNSEKDYKIEVFDLLGNKVMELTGNTINMKYLASATYIVNALDLETQETLSYKVIKD